MLRALARLLALLPVAIPALAPAQAANSENTNISASHHRSWPAGPYSQVSTGFGVMQTAVPLFSLDGPGRTSLGLSVHHTSNQAAGNTSVAVGHAGLGWKPSCVEYVVAGTQSGQGTTYTAEPYQVKAGNSASNWYVPSFNVVGGVPIPSSFERRPGTRAELAELPRAGSQIQGYVVTEQADATRWYYRHQGNVGGFVGRWYLTSMQDPRGNTVNYRYDGYDRVDRITDAAGRYATLTWGSGTMGQLQRVVLTTAAGSRTWDFNYTTNANNVPNCLGSIDFPSPDARPRPSLRFDYTNAINIQNLYDLRGSRWNYGYGAVLPASSTIGVTAVYEPSLTNPTTAVQNSPTTFAWNADAANYKLTCTITDRLGKLWYHVYQNGVPPSTPSATLAPWMSNPIVQVQDATYAGPGGAAAYAWETFEWNYGDATLKRHVDRNGTATEYTYETAWPNTGLPLTEKRYLDGAPKVWTYQNWKGTATSPPRRVRTLDPEGRRSVVGMNWTYDEAIYTNVDPYQDDYAQAQGQTYQFPGALDLKTNFLYNAQGELTDTWMGNDPHAVSSNFDAYGNARTVTDPAGGGTALTFDPWGNKTSQTGPSPLGKTEFAYDDWDQLVGTTLPDGHNTGSSYDNNGNRTYFRKEDGTLLTTTFDPLDRPTFAYQPTDGSTVLTTEFHYDLRGARDWVKNPRGYVTYTDYDDRGMAWRVRYPDGTSRQSAFDKNGNRVRSANGRGHLAVLTYDTLDRLAKVDYAYAADVTYEYRIDGPRTKMVDGTGTTTYTYDAAGRLKTEARTLTGKTLTTTYVAGANRRRSLGDGVQTWTYNYDAGLRLGSLNQTVGSGTPASYTYKPSGAVDVRTFANGTKTAYGYDSRGRTTAIAHRTTAGTALHTLGYRYGADGNLDRYTYVEPNDTNWTADYVHDKAGRLLSDAFTSPYGTISANSYTYDGAGNRLSATRNGAASAYGPAGPNDAFWYGEGYELSGYDADGNPGRIDGPGFTMDLGYDESSRVAWITGSVASAFRYDGDGRRVERTEGGATTRFVYDGDQVVEELGGSNSVLLYRTPGVGFVRNGAQRYDYESSVGSSVAVRDASGALTGRTQYDAFGREVFSDVGVDRGDFRFGGAHGYVNDYSGMQLLGARYYLPALGRFLTQDPIGHAGGPNLYAYCDNSPLSRIDPSGLQDRGAWDNLMRGKRAAIFMGDPGEGEWWQRRMDHEGDHWLAMKYANRLALMGYTVTVYAPDTVAEALRYVKGADALVLIGHGRSMTYNGVGKSYGGIMLSNEGGHYGTRLGSEDLLSALGGRRLDHLFLFACGQGNAKYLPAWFRASYEVYGSAGAVNVGGNETLTHYRPRGRK